MIGLASFAFVGGAFAGSFIGVVADRLPRGLSIVRPRSRCDGCGATVAGYDNIPILSWILLRGRCRRCGTSIPVRYPIVEAGLGAAFVITTVLFADDPLQLALGLALTTVLAAITLTDLDQRIIPNSIVLAGALAGLAIAAVGDPSSLPERLIAAAAGGGVLFLIALAYPQGLGMGDAKLVGAMGIFLGSSLAPAVLIGFAAGALVGGVMIARHGAAARKTAIPFGPFLALGGLVGLWAGDSIVHWYTSSFFGS
jgi:leader peptidase (prepilin peptidase)/N-methyltransferase